MKRQNVTRWAGLLAVAALVFAGVVGRTSDVTAGLDEAAEARAALLQNAAGVEKGDLKMIGAVWAQDESASVFESGQANYGWQDYSEHHLGPELKELKNVKYAYSDLNLKTSGNTAWATFKYTLAADLKERHIESAGLGTAVLEKRAGHWLIVHLHTSAPRRPAAPAATPKSDE